MFEIKREEEIKEMKEESKEEPKEESKEEPKEETKEESKEESKEEPKEESNKEFKEESICHSQLQFISKPNEVQFDQPVHAQKFMAQQIADLIIQEPLIDVTRAATGAVIYDGLIHKQQCGCIMC
jgi:uncharacterized membrane protein YdbT with pleckstrin-like domain